MFKKLCESTKWSVAGLRHVYKHELSFRMELLACVLLAPLAILIANNVMQLLCLWLVLGMVLIVELLNTALEITVNRISLEKHTLSKHVKDVASAAVFVSILFATLAWLLIIWNNFYAPIYYFP